MYTTWVQRLKDYHEFLDWDDDEESTPPDYANMTEDEAKEILRDDLEFIIGTNSYGELYETEKEYMKLLDMGVE